MANRLYKVKTLQVSGLSGLPSGVLSVLIPQVWLPPALTAVKVPAGGLAWPE